MIRLDALRRIREVQAEPDYRLRTIYELVPDYCAPSVDRQGFLGVMMRFDKCECCGGPVRGKRVTVDLRRGGQLCVFRNVPVGVCTRCGERYYPGPVLERLDELAQHGLAGAKTIRVPTFDCAQVERL